MNRQMIYLLYARPSLKVLGVFALRSAAMESISASFPEGQAQWTGESIEGYPADIAHVTCSDGSTAVYVIQLIPLLSSVVDLNLCGA